MNNTHPFSSSYPHQTLTRYIGNILNMMTSSNGNIFRVTGPLCGEFTGQRWIPLTKASDAELWCFLWSVPWTNGWVNNGEAGDLRRHCVHYGVTVMDIFNRCYLKMLIGKFDSVVYFSLICKYMLIVVIDVYYHLNIKVSIFIFTSAICFKMT